MQPVTINPNMHEAAKEYAELIKKARKEMTPGRPPSGPAYQAAKQYHRDAFNLHGSAWATETLKVMGR